MENERTEEIEISLGDIIHSIKEHFWMIVGCGLAVFAIMFAYIKFFAVPVYQSSTTVIVNPLKNSSSISDITDGFSNNTNITTEMGLITSKANLVQALNLLELNNYRDADGVSYKEIYSSKIAQDNLSQKVSVSVENNSRKVTITVKDSNNIFAADYANAVATSYKNFLAQFAKDSKVAQRATIEKQIPENEKLLSEAREKLAAFKSEYGTSQIQSKIEVLNPQVAYIQMQEDPLSLQMTELEDSLDSSLIASAEADSAIAESLADYYRILKEYTLYENIEAGTPSDRALSLKNSKDIAAQRIYSEVAKFVSSAGIAKSLYDYLVVSTTYSVLEDLEKSYANELSQYQSIIVSLEELESNVSIYQSIELSLKQMLEETKILESSVESNVIIVDAAEVANHAVSPRKLVLLAVGLFAGAFIGFALALVIDLSDVSVRHESTIRQILGEEITSLGWIPYAQKLVNNSPLIVLNSPDSYTSERYRILTGNISLVKDANTKVISICSTDSSEGKSSCAINVAVNYALLSKKILVIDGDLRRPEMENYFQVARSKKGLTDIVMGKAVKEDVIVRPVKSLPNLHLLPAGGSVSNPNIIFNAKQFTDLINDLKKTYDLIFIDCPPLSYGSDFVLISRVLDAYMLNIRAGVTTKPGLLAYKEQCKSFTLPCLGYIFYGTLLSNRGSYGYGYGYGYGYSNYGYNKYGYGYNNDDEKTKSHRKVTYKKIHKKELEERYRKSKKSNYPVAPVAYINGKENAFTDDAAKAVPTPAKTEQKSASKQLDNKSILRPFLGKKEEK